MKFLQCGYGQIGHVLYPNFKLLANSVSGTLEVYDPNVTDCPSHVNDISAYYDFTFICVPTNKKEDGSADTSIVIDLCNSIHANIIILKSTVPLDIQHYLPSNVIYSPEFTSTTPHKGVQNFVVLGGNRTLCNKVAALYKKIHSADFQIIFTDIKTAIMAKYTINSFLALKVTFCNEIAQACRKNNIEYDDVRNIFIQDSRINPSHTFVYEESPFYDSHCFNKDIPAFNAQFHLPLMQAVETINNKMKEIFKSQG